MRNVIGAFNSSIQYNKTVFWIDRENGNNYFVGVQYPPASIESLEALLNVPITGVNQATNDRRVAERDSPPYLTRPELALGPSREQAPPLLGSLVTLRRSSIATEVKHLNIQPSIDVDLNIIRRDLGHVADDVARAVGKFGETRNDSGGSDEEGTVWDAYDPAQPDKLLEGTRIVLSGEYARMQQTFRNLALGLILAVVLVYFLMVALDKSYIVPFVNILVVPLVLAGILPVLYFTGTSLNIQSLLGIIFTVGIKVSATVLLTDVAQEMRKSEGLSPTEAIRKTGELRARPIVMTALAAFFAMVPAGLALERGSEANAPLGRAILRGLLVGTPATLFLAPALYALMVHGPYEEPEDPEHSRRVASAS